MPLTATIAPARSAWAAAEIASGGGEAASGGGEAASPRRAPPTRGPHAGHAFGWAWKRRSRGSSYSRRHSAHISNAAIVVHGRSYGTPVTIVKRGPQSVQLMNG